MRLTPLARLIVGQYPHLLALPQAQLVLSARRKIVQCHEQLRVVLLWARRQQVLFGGPSVGRLKARWRLRRLQMGDVRALSNYLFGQS